MFNQSTWSGITTQTDNQIQYTSDRKIYVLKAGARSTLNGRTFKSKRAHVLVR